MRELVVRVRHHGDDFTATVRQVAAGSVLDAPSAPGTEDAVGTASTAVAAILAGVIAARIPTVAIDKRQPPARPTHGGYPTLEPPTGLPAPPAAQDAPQALLSPAEVIRDVYEMAIIDIASVVGWNDPEIDIDIKPRNGISLERVPESVINAGHAAIKWLAAATGILDTPLDAGGGIPVEDALAHWTKDRP